MFVIEKTHLIFILLLLSLAGNNYAQTYSSNKLTELGDLFPQNCIPPVDSIFSCQQIIKGKSFVVKYNSHKEIEHIGVSLFSQETKDIINLPICNFIERFMLEVILQKDPKNIIRKLDVYGVNFEKNGTGYRKGNFTSMFDVLNDIQHPTKFYLTKDSKYKATWEYGKNNVLCMYFPVSRELIFGSDKKESDKQISDLFTNQKCQKIASKNIESISKSDLIAMNGSDLYKRKGNVFLVNDFNSDSYYQRSDTTFQLLFDQFYPEESLANLFVTRKIETSLNLYITHRMYGGFTPEFIVPLNDFLCIFDQEFSTFCMIHQTSPEIVNLSVILYNNNFNYIHLLRIKTSKQNIFSSKGALVADLYTNIPQHNIKNLFLFK